MARSDHAGKRPVARPAAPRSGPQLIRLRREMKEAMTDEKYERARICVTKFAAPKTGAAVDTAVVFGTLRVPPMKTRPRNAHEYVGTRSDRAVELKELTQQRRMASRQRTRG